MRKIYFKNLMGVILASFAIILLWIIYFTDLKIKEGFTPKIREMYRPYVRTFNQGYQTFVNNYGPQVILCKLRKWNIY